MLVPPIEEQFVSDAVNTIEGVTAESIAELWVDQNATEQVSEAEFGRAVKATIPDVEYYLAPQGGSGEAA